MRRDNAGMEQRWWYKPDGSIVGFLDENQEWFFTTTGEMIAYIRDAGIYSPSGSVVGFLDSDGKNIFSQSGQHLGFLSPS